MRSPDISIKSYLLVEALIVTSLFFGILYFWNQNTIIAMILIFFLVTTTINVIFDLKEGM